MATRPIIALVTDFGDADAYAAAMKGVILTRCPGAVIVDVTHRVPRHDVAAGAYLLWSVFRDFPAGTIFVAVVDPGVGSARALCCTRAGGRVFLAPDNGILDLVLDETRESTCVALDVERFWRTPVSATFHGRDILAPVAAAVWNGTPLKSLGSPVKGRRPGSVFQRVTPSISGRHTGRIVSIDSFGNIITNFRADALPGRSLELRHKRARITRTATHYAAGPAGAPFILLGSGGLLELSVRNGSAARRLRARRGDPLTLILGENA
jgi:S-adenosylmethionine hydrolase